MANKFYTFSALVYRNGEHGEAKEAQPITIESSGSQETRARRRVLDEMHARGLLVRRLIVSDVRTAK